MHKYKQLLQLQLHGSGQLPEKLPVSLRCFGPQMQHVLLHLQVFINPLHVDQHPAPTSVSSIAQQLTSVSSCSMAILDMINCLTDRISDTRSQRCTDVQSLVKCAHHRHCVSYTVKQGCV